MRTLKQVLIATMIFVVAMLANNSNAVASDQTWRQEMRQNCDQHQSPGDNRQKCYNRYRLGTAPIFRDEKRRYRDDRSWFEPERPRYREHRRQPRHERRYLESYDYVPNQDWLAVLSFGLGVVSAIQKMEPREDCREHIVLDRYGNEQYVCE